MAGQGHDKEAPKSNHGDMTDGAALLFLLIALQLCLMPSLNFGSGVWTEEKNTADTQILMKIAAAQLIYIATMFSGVKWDSLNGKVAGIGGFVAVIGILKGQWDEDGFEPNLMWAYALIFMVGIVKIFAFPSNERPEMEEREDSWKQCPDFYARHFNCNFIECLCFCIAITCVACMWHPAYWLMKDHDAGASFGDGTPKGTPHIWFKAQLSPTAFVSPPVYVLIKFNAFLSLWICAILLGVGWNRINGKLPGIGGFLSSLLICYFTYATGIGIVMKPSYILATYIFLSALLIAVFPAFPNLPPKKEADKEGRRPSTVSRTSKTAPLLP